MHVVGRGQTLDRIAKRYHVSVDAIREANDLGPGSGHLHPGLSLVIPQKGRPRGAVAVAGPQRRARSREGEGREGRQREAERGRKGHAAARKERPGRSSRAGWSGAAARAAASST